jgi:hypothetical protein
VDERTDVGGSTRPTRRTIARGAAWSVPVVAVAAAAPAFAASGGTASVTGQCTGGRTGSIQVVVNGTSAQYVRVQLSHTGSGTYTVTSAPSGAQTCGDGCYLLPVTNGSVNGTFLITLTVGQSGTGTVTADISSSPGGQVITGDTSGYVSIRRTGSSSNYSCAGTG